MTRATEFFGANGVKVAPNTCVQPSAQDLLASLAASCVPSLRFGRG